MSAKTFHTIYTENESTRNSFASIENEGEKPMSKLLQSPKGHTREAKAETSYTTEHLDVLTLDLPDFLHTQRLERDFSQRDVAEQTGVSQPRISYYEHGAATPSALRLAALLDALGYRLVIIPKEGE